LLITPIRMKYRKTAETLMRMTPRPIGWLRPSQLV
jgi:hypothetical protein